MRNLIGGVAILTLTACGSDQLTGPYAPAFSALTSTVSQIVPVSLNTFVSCAAGGAGEDVVVGGSLHVVSHVTMNAAGGLSFKSQFQPQGVFGWGSVTGDKYQGTGVTQEKGTVARGETYTLINRFRMVGPRNNFVVQQTVHFTVNAAGELTATVAESSTTCS